MALSFLSALSIWILYITPGQALGQHPFSPPSSFHIKLPKDIQHSWGPYSPYFALASYEVPEGCEVTQVNVLERHGARFPTSGPSAMIRAAIAKLQAVPEFTDPRLDFVHNYTYDLGISDLVPFGAAQSFESGELHYHRYISLINSSSLPFIRSSSAERCVASATNWTAGFASASHGKFDLPLSVILDEATNDTLDDAMCAAAGSADPQTNAWLAIYAPPIAARLSAAAPGAHLTAADAHALLSQCAFDSVAHARASAFCALFTRADFAGFEYAGDLGKYYGTGYGQALGRVQGVGYVNELLARLARAPVRDRTQTNATLDADPATFPLDRAVYVDFSHDNQMVAIYAALGLFPEAPLDPARPDPARSWVASRLTPFSARMVTEKMRCRRGEGEGEYVRILVNDAQQPLDFCGRGDGLCELEAFVKSQTYARNDGEGDWEKCFAL